MKLGGFSRSGKSSVLRRGGFPVAAQRRHHDLLAPAAVLLDLRSGLSLDSKYGLG
jgi:hypothetical protein